MPTCNPECHGEVDTAKATLNLIKPGIYKLKVWFWGFELTIYCETKALVSSATPLGP